jgi:hypothetical protein
MEDTVGMNMKTRNEILNAIFGADGIVSNTDMITYQTRVNNLRSMIIANDSSNSEKSFISYFENKLRPSLETYVIEPVRLGRIQPNWTNNNCESANHILKSATQWKLFDLVKFVHKLYDIVVGEQEERCKAIRDMGNFRLSDRYVHNLIDVDRWAALQEDQREKKTNRFLMDYGRSKPNEVTSADDTRTAIKTPSAGRKPNQRKRKCAERSRTPSKSAKRRL